MTDQSIELKKRELAELKKQSDRIKAEIKAYEEKVGEKLCLTCFDMIPTDREIRIMPNLPGPFSVAKSEVGRLARFVEILKGKYGA